MTGITLTRIVVWKFGGEPHGEVLFKIGPFRRILLTENYMTDLTRPGSIIENARKNVIEGIKTRGGKVLGVSFTRER